MPRRPCADDRPGVGRPHEPFGPSSSDRADPATLRRMDAVPDRQPAARATAAPTSCSPPRASAGIETHVLARRATTSPQLARDARGGRARDGRRRRVARAGRGGRRSSATCRSPASRSGRATTSRATSGSTATTRSARSTRSSTGEERRIDVGRANDRLFLNNVSLGVYARLVHRREHHRRRSDAFARLRALAHPGQHRAPHRHHRRRGADRGARRARREQRVRARRALARRARAARRGAAAPLRAAGRPALELGGAGRRVVRVDARAGRLHAAVDGEPEGSRRRSSSASSRARYACSLPRGPAA